MVDPMGTEWIWGRFEQIDVDPGGFDIPMTKARLDGMDIVRS